MAFTNYGPGNWFGLPELNITESLFGGNTNSVSNAQYRSAAESLPTAGTYDPYAGTQSFNNSSTGYTPDANYTAPTIDTTGLTPEQIKQAEEDAAKAQEEAYINQYYGQAMDTLNSQQSALMGNEQNFYNIATTPYTSQVPLINQASQEGQNAITGQQNKAGLQEQNALAAARRLYDELTSRNRQAFGSGALGSVGQAASEVLGRSSQNQFGSIRNQASSTMNDLYTASRDLETKTQAQLQSLEQQKQTALSQAKIAFQEKLDYINQKKGEVSQAKSQAKLDALKEYRDFVRQLSSQAEALRQQVAGAAATNQAAIQQQAQAYQGEIGGAVSMGDTGLANQLMQGNKANAGLLSNNVLGGDAGASQITSQLYGGYNPADEKKKLYDTFNAQA